MAKKLFLIIVFFCIIFFLYKTFHNTSSVSSVSQRVTQSKPTSVSVTPLSTFSSQSIFVPYWAVDTNVLPHTYDTAIYFGITANEQGIDKTEDGYTKLPKFFHMVHPGMKTLLTIRLLSSDINQKFLDDTSFQQAIISESVYTAKSFGFSGIVVDFEYNALAFPSVVNSITTAMQQFEGKSHAEQLSYYQAFYGDNFYRLRPYDIGAISKHADGVFILAYDLHKANGDAGPNFPVTSSNDYTFFQMVHDFSQQIDLQKMIVVFGMFGYDWTLGDQGKTISIALARSLTDVQDHFINSCSFSLCTVTSQESGTKITYTKNKDQHIIWVDPQSILTKKKQLLLQSGIGKISYWAYGYF